MSDRTKIDVPEDLEQWVEQTFGDASKSESEAYRMALWYARHQYRLETDDTDD